MELRQTIDALVESCRLDVPDCVGVGVVDLSTGMMLRGELDGDDGGLAELLAAASADLFAGRAVRRVERLMRERRGGTDDKPYFQEILVHSTNLVHLFLRSRRHPDVALGIACAPTVKTGLLLTSARRLMRDFDAEPVS